MLPNEPDYARRLQEINSEHGFIEVESIVGANEKTDTPDDSEQAFDNFAIVPDEETLLPRTSFETFENLYAAENDSSAAQTNGNGFYERLPKQSKTPPSMKSLKKPLYPAEEIPNEKPLSLSDERRIQQELESVEFYVAQGYTDLAVKSLDALEAEFGNRQEFDQYRNQLENPSQNINSQPESVEENESDNSVSESENPVFDPFGDFRDELGIEENEISSAAADDYETHSQLATAYKEMGLLEDAIKEFQDAINMVLPDDGTGRFFQCATMLGFCFMEKQMPNLALMWYRRALETVNLGDDEKHALKYEIACAYQAGGDEEKARKYFEQVYVVDVDYRDVSERLQKLQATVLQ